MTDDFDRLLPPHLAQTVRSLPRRVRRPLHADDRSVEEILAVRAGDHTVADLLAGLLAALVTGDRWLELTVLHRAPSLPPLSAGSEAPIESTLAAVDERSAVLADRIDGVAADDWNRTARRPDGTSVTALDIARDTVRRAVTALRRIEAAVAAG